MSERLKLRKEQKVEDTWRLEDLYGTPDEFKADYEDVKKKLPVLSSYETRMTESPKELYDYLSLKEEVSLKVEKLYVYSHQFYHEDTGNSMAQELSDSAQTLSNQLSQCISFEDTCILSMSDEQFERFLREKPELKKYERYLLEIFKNKEHVRSREAEELLAGAKELGQAPSNIFTMFDNADLKFEPVMDSEGVSHPLSHANYTVFLKSPDRELRKNAFFELYHTYEKYQNTIATMYNSNLKQEHFFARARKFESSRQMELFYSHIPEKVYDNLILAVHNHMEPMYRYMKLRKRCLGVDELHFYDVYTPIVEDVNEHIPFDRAKEIVAKALAPMGEEYVSFLREGFENRWIDVYENEGKRSGAYSWGVYNTHPYVLLNYKDDLNSMFTLAHEMGHALHSYYSDKNQEYFDAGYRIFVAEVASTCNESLLMQYLLKKCDEDMKKEGITAEELSKLKKKKAGYINYYLEQFRTTLYRQTMFAEFENITHKMVGEGKALTYAKLREIYLDLNRLYFGGDVAVDEEIGLEWARIPHFYTPFYVYQYATGYSAAIALSDKILKEGKSAADRYIGNFLCGGCSKTPIELLLGAGVDMESPKPVEDALAVFEGLVGQMEELMEEKEV